MVRPLPLQCITHKIYPCNQTVKNQTRKINDPPCSDCIKNGTSKIIANSPDGDTVLLISLLFPLGDTLHKLGSLYASLVFLKQKNLGRRFGQ